MSHWLREGYFLRRSLKQLLLLWLLNWCSSKWLSLKQAQRCSIKRSRRRADVNVARCQVEDIKRAQNSVGRHDVNHRHHLIWASVFVHQLSRTASLELKAYWERFVSAWCKREFCGELIVRELLRPYRKISRLCHSQKTNVNRVGGSNQQHVPRQDVLQIDFAGSRFCCAVADVIVCDVLGSSSFRCVYDVEDRPRVRLMTQKCHCELESRQPLDCNSVEGSRNDSWRAINRLCWFKLWCELHQLAIAEADDNLFAFW